MNNELIKRIKNILGVFCDDIPEVFNSQEMYIFSTERNLMPCENPIYKRFKFDLSSNELITVRLRPLLVIPQVNFQNSFLQILFYQNKDWGFVLPNFEINHTIYSVDEVRDFIFRNYTNFIEIESLTDVIYAGGHLSFKKSPSYKELNAYIFPIFILRTTFNSNTQKQHSGKIFKFLSKNDIEISKNFIKKPNGDVYRSLERLFSDWTILKRFAFEYDIAISYAGEQRKVADIFVEELNKHGNFKIFYDPLSNLVGHDLKRIFYSIYFERSKSFVPIISDDYFGQKKVFTLYEFDAALERFMIDKARQEKYILPIMYNFPKNIPNQIRGIGYLEMNSKKCTYHCPKNI